MNKFKLDNLGAAREAFEKVGDESFYEKKLKNIFDADDIRVLLRSTELSNSAKACVLFRTQFLGIQECVRIVQIVLRGVVKFLSAERGETAKFCGFGLMLLEKFPDVTGEELAKISDLNSPVYALMLQGPDYKGDYGMDPLEQKAIFSIHFGLLPLVLWKTFNTEIGWRSHTASSADAFVSVLSGEPTSSIFPVGNDFVLELSERCEEELGKFLKVIEKELFEGAVGTKEGVGCSWVGFEV